MLARVVVVVTIWSRASHHEADPDHTKRHDGTRSCASDRVKLNESSSYMTCLLESLFPHFPGVRLGRDTTVLLSGTSLRVEARTRGKTLGSIPTEAILAADHTARHAARDFHGVSQEFRRHFGCRRAHPLDISLGFGILLGGTGDSGSDGSGGSAGQFRPRRVVRIEFWPSGRQKTRRPSSVGRAAVS